MQIVRVDVLGVVLVVVVDTRCQCVERSVWPLQVVAVACCLVLSGWFVSGWNGEEYRFFVSLTDVCHPIYLYDFFIPSCPCVRARNILNAVLHSLPAGLSGALVHVTQVRILPPPDIPNTHGYRYFDNVVYRFMPKNEVLPGSRLQYNPLKKVSHESTNPHGICHELPHLQPQG